MAGDTDNPRIWGGGDVYVAPVGTPAPTNIATALNAGFKPLGLLDESGMVESRDETITDYWAWGGILVRTTRSKHKRTIKVTALESNPVVYDLVNPGSDETESGSISTRTVKVPTANPKAFVIETTDGDITRRRYIPRGEVLEVGDITAADEEMEMFELTITVYPDADGVLWKDISDDAQALSA